MTWSIRVRDQDLALSDPLEVTTLKLVENYNIPDMVIVDGRLLQLQPGLVLGFGVVIHDDTGTERFSGYFTHIERNGDGTGNLVYTGDLVNLWDRTVYPVYNAAFTTAGQTAAYDAQTGPAETRLLTYINRNCGTIAYHSGADDRRITHLRLPTTLGRGPSAKTSARFDNLGVLATQLAESADLRLQVVQTFDGLTPYLDVTLTSVPDMSAYIRFGTAEASGPALLGSDTKYSLETPAATVILSAAGGEGIDRLLNAQRDGTRETDWGRRIEQFIDQRGTTDATEITQGMADAMLTAAGATSISLPVISTPDFTIGTDVPLGAKAAAVIDGLTVVERIRQITTTVGGTGATVDVEAIFGSPDAGIPDPTQRDLAAALRRIGVLERSQ